MRPAELRGAVSDRLRVDRAAWRGLFWLASGYTVAVGALVVFPFYAYEIPIAGVGGRDDTDVKRFWPFAFDGLGSVIHAITMWLAALAPLFLLATAVGGVLLFLRGKSHRFAALIFAVLSVVVGAAYAIHWEAILLWHFD